MIKIKKTSFIVYDQHYILSITLLLVGVFIVPLTGELFIITAAFSMLSFTPIIAFALAIVKILTVYF